MRIFIHIYHYLYKEIYWIIDKGRVREYNLIKGFVETHNYSPPDNISPDYIEISPEDLKKAKLLGSFDFLRDKK